MASRKNPTPFYVIEFDTAAERLAYTFDGSEVGRAFVRDLETSAIYMVMKAGVGSTAGVMTVITSALGEQSEKCFSLYDAREVTAGGDVGNIVANGGILASDTTPVLDGDANNSQEIIWATGNADPIAFTVALPGDFDGSRDVTLKLRLASGSTDAATFGVATSWDGGAEVTDSASDASTKSATQHTITATIDKADIPDSASTVTIRLTPPAHATNTIVLTRVSFLYYTR